MEIENLMVSEEIILNCLKICILFWKDSDEDCIKCFYFYNKLKMFG